ncbi:mitogen-activated protein kinase kinase kinase 19-like isoform X2 [Polyodon spathula]|nr:mitogen-activated protein kinase kinase kinase 19-like isoform X2 [Polyodon spathula]
MERVPMNDVSVSAPFDFPNPDTDFNPLISASYKGLTEVVCLLLKKGVDVTLCNHSNQTAVHLANPTIQGILLSAVNGDALPQRQLLQAAWQGDLQHLQHLLAESATVDVNVPNQDGLNALMLAVRDIDLFERLRALLPSEYRPVEVIKELLKNHVDPRACDSTGKSALHYAAQLKSSIKEQVIQVLVDLLPLSDQQALLDLLAFSKPLANSVSSFPPQNSIILESITCMEERKQESKEQSECRKSKSAEARGFSLDFQTAAKTLQDMSQAYEELAEMSSQGISLPSLWQGYHKRQEHGPIPDGTHLPLHPIRSNGRNKQQIPVFALSKSEPNIAAPLLRSNSLQDIKAQIQQRLKITNQEKVINRPNKESLPCMKARPARTPRHLYPLEVKTDVNKAQEKRLLHFIKSVPFKPPVLLPLSPRPQASKRKNRLTSSRADRQEGSSSSSSTQGSLDEDYCKSEEIHRQVKDCKDESEQKSDIQRQVNVGVNVDADFQNEPKVKQFNSVPKDKDRVQEQRTAEGDQNTVFIVSNNCEQPLIRATDSEQVSSKYNYVDICDLGNDEIKPDLQDALVPVAGEKSGCNDNGDNQAVNEESTFGNEQLLPVVHITISEAELETREETKIPKNKVNMKSVLINVNHSFNIIAQEEYVKTRNETRSNLRNKSSPANLKPNCRRSQGLMIKGECTTKQGGFQSNNEKVQPNCTGLPVLPNGCTAPSKVRIKAHPVERKCFMKIATLPKKQPLPRIYRSAHQVKKQGAASTPRAKSAADILQLNYDDMFKEINSNEEGPGIYEMFGTPVYSNIRVSTASGSRSSREVQSAPPRKSSGHKPSKSSKAPERSRPKKTSHGKLNLVTLKQKNKDVLKKGKHHKRLLSNEEQEGIVFISGPDWHIKTSKSEVLFCELDGMNDLQTSKNIQIPQATELEDQTIIGKIQTQLPDRTIGSVNPNSVHNRGLLGIQMLDHDAGLAESDEEPNEPDPCIPKGESFVCDETENKDYSGFHQISKQDTYPTPPKINTWTSASNRVVSPTYQRFLESASNDLTDELLCRLAEELLSLDEKDTENSLERNYPSPEENNNVPEEAISRSQERSNCKYIKVKNYQPLMDQTSDKLSETPSRPLSNSDSYNTKDAITWTKGDILGRGAYGTVYCGLTNQGQLIAVKQVALDPSDQVTAEKEYQRLQEEVDLLKTLDHCNIVGFLGTCLEVNIVSIFMEFVPGGSVASIINRFGPLPEKVFAIYTKQILEGVEYLHNSRVIHRDLKGNNVMLMPTGIIKLIDFGCAKRLACLNTTGTNSEMLKSMHGTPYWMAPEVINETGHGRKSDIWSIGCTVFEMATGKPPLAHMERMAALFYIGARKGLMPSLPDHFSESARNFVQACLTSDQRERPSAKQLLEHPFIKQEK